MQQPNILFIIADQLRADHTGFGGNALVRTPHLDALAARATQFNGAHVANPICMPNRATILTGRLPSVHGTRFNGIPIDPHAHTFVRELRRNGYRTAHIGKAHFQNLGDGPPDLADSIFTDPGDAFTPGHPDGWDQYEQHARHASENVQVPGDYYGFSHTELVTHHGDLCGGHYYQWAKSKGVDLHDLAGRDHALQKFDDWRQVYQTAVPEELYASSYVAERTCEFLQQHTSDQPFFLHVSFPDPHHPFTPPGKYYDMYHPADIPLPNTWHDPHTHSMPHYRFMKSRQGKAPKLWVAAFAPSEAQFRHAAAAEYGMISMIDTKVGAILQALAASGKADDTVVVFTSDHGDMFGDHGMILKGAMHYSGCTRIPLLIAEPGQSARTTPALASSLDLAQTMLDIAGVPDYHGMQGKSLTPLMRGTLARLHDELLIEEDEMFDMLFIDSQFRGRTLVTETDRLSIYHGTEQGEHFHLAEDPDELSNLWREARPARAELTERLAHALMAAADRAPKPTQLA